MRQSPITSVPVSSTMKKVKQTLIYMPECSTAMVLCIISRKYMIRPFCYETAIKLDPQNYAVNDIEDMVPSCAKCGGCSAETIRGIRFKCRVCDNHDLCVGCFQRRSEIHPQHQNFLEIPRSNLDKLIILPQGDISLTPSDREDDKDIIPSPSS